jgi:hypothetical protein
MPHLNCLLLTTTRISDLLVWFVCSIVFERVFDVNSIRIAGYGQSAALQKSGFGEFPFLAPGVESMCTARVLV